MKKKNIELISVTVKIDGKEETFKKENVYFYGWQQECDCCSHGGVDMELTDGKNTIGRIVLQDY